MSHVIHFFWSWQNTFTTECLSLCPPSDFVNTLLAHGKGAAFYVLPNSGTLAAFETKTVEVTAYTDMWGEYRDHLICKVWTSLRSSHLHYVVCCGRMLQSDFSPAGGGSGATAHFHSNDSEGMSTLLPDDRPTNRWPEPGADHTVRVTVSIVLFLNFKSIWCIWMWCILCCTLLGLAGMYLEQTQSPVHSASTIPRWLVNIISWANDLMEISFEQFKSLRVLRENRERCTPCLCLLTDIRVDWEIYNIDPLSTKVLDVLVTYGEAFPLKDADGNEVMAEALSFSDGDVQTPWQRNSDYERTSFSRQTQSVSTFNTEAKA